MSGRSALTPPGDVVVLVGTLKGAFLFWSSAARTQWRMDGPHFKGEAVYALAFDQRGGRHRALAATNSNHWGSVIRTSDDFGATWSAPDRKNISFPDGAGVALNQVWQIRPGPPSDPDMLWCGVEPAALFQSRDAGETWSLNEGLFASNNDGDDWTELAGGLPPVVCVKSAVIGAS